MSASLSPSSTASMAMIMADRGDMPGAIKLLRDTLETQRQKEGEQHPEVLRSMNHLGWMLKAAGQMDESLMLLRQALSAQREVLGSRHPDTLTSINKLALLLQDQGDEEAVVLCREALQARRDVLGSRHPGTLLSTCSLGSLLYERGELEQARYHFCEAVVGARETLGDEHPHTRAFMQHLAAADRAIHNATHQLAQQLQPPPPPRGGVGMARDWSEAQSGVAAV